MISNKKYKELEDYIFGDQKNKNSEKNNNVINFNFDRDTSTSYESDDDTNKDYNKEFKGPRGPRGPRGLSGMNGKDGEIGLRGFTGKDGKNGKDGKDGKNGEQGPRGFPGKDGKNGRNGNRGPEGLAGKVGKDGKDGRDGRDGKECQCKCPCIYRKECKQSYKCNKYNRSEKGDKGDQGDKGDDGEKGEQGDKGDKGDKGDNNNVTMDSFFVWSEQKQCGESNNDFKPIVFEKGLMGPNKYAWTGCDLATPSCTETSIEGFSSFLCNQTGWYQITYMINISAQCENNNINAMVILTLDDNKIDGSSLLAKISNRNIYSVSNTLLANIEQDKKISLLFWTDEMCNNQDNYHIGCHSISLPINETTASLTVVRIS